MNSTSTEASVHVPGTQPDSQAPLWSGTGITAFGGTDVGRTRDSNQDSFAVDSSSGLYIVADGMGGRAGGEVASGMAVEIIKREVGVRLENLCSRELSARRNFLAQAVNIASLKIYERSLELPQYRGMGTTVTLLWIPPPESRAKRHSKTAIIAHVGDSRCYLLRCGMLYQVTDDHSLVNEQIKAGMIKRTDPIALQIKNVITRCVGYQEEEEVDTFTIELFENDRFLLCSDGLTNKVKDFEISEALSADDLSKVPATLIDLANERGGEDNITALVLAAV